MVMINRRVILLNKHEETIRDWKVCWLLLEQRVPSVGRLVSVGCHPLLLTNVDDHILSHRKSFSCFSPNALDHQR